jgi:hypothetical protein
MRILEFSPSNNVISVKTYSPWLKKYMTNVAHEFTVPYDVSLPSENYVLVDTIQTNATSFVARSPWLTNLAPNTTYDWFVKIQNGANVNKSPLWQFTTAAGTAPPLQIRSFHKDDAGHTTISWVARGGSRYRVEYSDAGPGGTFTGCFSELVRPVAEEVPPCPVGDEYVQIFTDDFSLTEPPPLIGGRFYRVRKVE